MLTPSLIHIKLIPAPPPTELRSALLGEEYLATVLADAQRLVGIGYHKGVHCFHQRFQRIKIPHLSHDKGGKGYNEALQEGRSPQGSVD